MLLFPQGVVVVGIATPEHMIGHLWSYDVDMHVEVVTQQVNHVVVGAVVVDINYCASSKITSEVDCGYVTAWYSEGGVCFCRDVGVDQND